MRQAHNKTKPILSIIAGLLLLACIVGAVLYWNAGDETITSDEPSVTDISMLPAYDDFNSPYVVVNKNKPYFGEDSGPSFHLHTVGDRPRQRLEPQEPATPIARILLRHRDGTRRSMRAS